MPGHVPEGQISRDLEPLAARAGVARLAHTAGVPVIHIRVRGTHPPHLGQGPLARLRKGVAEVVAVGGPLVVDADEDPRAAADRIMAVICAHVASAPEPYPRRPLAGEPTWWDAVPDTPRLRVCREVDKARYSPGHRG